MSQKIYCATFVSIILGHEYVASLSSNSYQIKFSVVYASPKITLFLMSPILFSMCSGLWEPYPYDRPFVNFCKVGKWINY